MTLRWPPTTERSATPDHLGHRERLRDRFLAAAARRCADYELLELLLFLAIPRRDVKPLAKALLDRFGSFAGVIAAAPERLQESRASATPPRHRSRRCRPAALRLRAGAHGRPVLGSWQKLLDYCRMAMARGEDRAVPRPLPRPQERADRRRGAERGTVDHTPVYPREVVKRALELGATASSWCTTIRPAIPRHRAPTSR